MSPKAGGSQLIAVTRGGTQPWAAQSIGSWVSTLSQLCGAGRGGRAPQKPEHTETQGEEAGPGAGEGRGQGRGLGAGGWGLERGRGEGQGRCALRRVRLCVTPWTVAHQAPLSLGFSSQEHWSQSPFPAPGGLPHPGMEPKSLSSPAWQADPFGGLPPSHMKG